MTVCIVLFALVMEIIWFLYIRWIVSPAIQPFKDAQPHLFQDPYDLLKKYFDILKNMEDVYHFEKWMRGWFLFIDFREIHAENVEAAFAWAVYTSRLEDLDTGKRESLVSLRRLAEKKFDICLPEGFNSKLELKHACMDLQPVTYINKPLLLYALLNCMIIQENMALHAKGFKRYTIEGTDITYWFKDEINRFDQKSKSFSFGEGSHHSYSSCEPSHREKTPILIFHGITRGWGYLFPMIDEFSERAIILIENPCICFAWITLDVANPDRICQSVKEILYRHDIQKVSLIGHSWGTFLAGWVVRMCPELVAHFTFCDPINLCVWLPET